MSFQNETWLGIRTDVADGGGTGTPSNPYAVNTPGTFASIVDGIPAGRIIRLMPGVYRTWGTTGNGYTMTQGIFTPQSGQRIVGSGMFSTIIQLVWDTDDTPNLIPVSGQAYHPGQRHYIIRSDAYLNSFELSDVTLDCNLQNVPKPFGPTKDSGSVTGSTQTGTPLPKVTASTGFFSQDMVGSTIVFPTASPQFSARIMEFVSASEVKLSAYQAISNLAFQVVAVRFAVTALSVVGDNVRIRRVRVINFGTRTPSLIDGQQAPNDVTYEGFPLRIEGRTLDTPSFNSVIEDCIFEQPNAWPGREVTCAVMASGVFRVTDPTKKLHLQPMGSVIRNCYFNFNFLNEPPGNPGPIDSISVSGSGPYTVTVTTLYAHNVAAGDYIEMAGNSPSTLNGRFLVASIIASNGSSRQLTFTLASNPGTPTAYGTLWKSTQPTMRLSLMTFSAGIVTVTTPMNHNRPVGDWVVITGAEQPEYNGTWQVASSSAVQFTFSLPSGSPSSPATGEMWLDRRPNSFVAVPSVKRSNQSPPKAELTCAGDHYRKVGDWIAVSGVLTAGTAPANEVNSYNNYVRISTVISSTKLEVELPGGNNIGAVGTTYAQGKDAGFGTNFQAIGNNGGFGGGCIERTRGI